MADLKMELISPLMVPDLWGYVRPYLAKACKRSRDQLKPDQVFQDCLAGSRNLLFFFDGDQYLFAAVVSFGDMDGKRVAHLNLVAGHSTDAWVDAIPLFGEWAKGHGAQEMTFSGGKAYERIVKGSKVKSVLYGLEL